MAQVINPALSMDASGNLGGICYVKWRGIQVARTARSGIFTPSADQIAQGVILASIAQHWASMTEGERNEWRRWAISQTAVDRLGRRYTPSGYQQYMKLSFQRGRFGGAPFHAPPTTGITFCQVVLTATPNVGRTYISLYTVMASGSPMPHFIEYRRAGPFDSQGRRATDAEFKTIYLTSGGNSYNDTATVCFKFYWYRGRGITAAGQVGNWFQVQQQQ